MSSLVVEGNTIGLLADRVTAAPNSKNGVSIGGGTTATIGGATSASRNLIAGNSAHNIIVVGNGAAPVTVRNNWIGIGSDGRGVANGFDGFVYWTGSTGTATVRDNVIGAAGRYGIWLANGSGHQVHGNRIGTDPTGQLARANVGGGIRVLNAGVTATIGSATAADRNLISGNTPWGVSIEQAGAVTVQGNSIGLAADGVTALGNGTYGIGVEASTTGVTIGGANTGEGNAIAGNGQWGVVLTGNSNTVAGNRIGASVDGGTARPNAGGGITVSGTGNTVGGTTSAAGNQVVGDGVTTGNTDYGIYVTGSDTTIRFNRVGLNAAGTATLLGTRYGIYSQGARTTIRDNTVSGNGLGMWLGGGANHVVQGNRIGTAVDGTTLIGNTTEGGLAFTNAVTDTTVGGSGAGEPNVIAGNAPGFGLIARAGWSGGVPARIRVTRNSIYGNVAGQGLELVQGYDGTHVYGPTANDGATNALTPNNGIDSPVFTRATLSGTTLSLTGYVGSAAGQTAFPNMTIEVFASDGDSSGVGSGRTYLGAIAGGGANGSFSGTLDVTGLGLVAGARITATAIDASGNTSEFGAQRVVGGTAYGVDFTSFWVDASDVDGDGTTAGEPTVGATVLALSDRSGYGRDFASQSGNQPTSASSAAFAKRVLSFTPSQWMQQAQNFPAPATVVYVARSASLTGRVLQSVANNWLLGWWGSGEELAHFDGWVTSLAGTVRTSRARIHSAVIRGGGSTTDVYADGYRIASSTGGTTGPNGLAINAGTFGNEPSSNEIGEILVFPRVLSDSERATVEVALGAKWGVTISRTVTPQTAVSQSGTAGALAASTPRVRVTMPDGTASAGTPVTFTVSSGVGTLAGATSAVVNTDASGYASAPAWTLGATGTIHRVSASVTGSRPNPVIFNAYVGCVPYGVCSGLPALWIDASDPDGDGNASNDPSAGSTFSTLVDLSGNNRHLLQTVGGGG
ncbi:MAG: beta strand repeat-containing protein, partial [Burkholderiaceae bacterium]